MSGYVDRLRTGLFGSWTNSAVTLATAGFAWLLFGPVVRWALIDATWSGDASLCASRDGACWAFVGEKLRFILFAFYPPDRHWREAAAVALLLALFGLAASPRFWSGRALLAGGLTLSAVWALLGGWPGGPAIAQSQWGGLALTLLVAVVAIVGGFPVGLALALGRRSRLRVVSWLCATYVEITRGVPLIAVLYVAMLVLPLTLPAGVEIEKLSRTLLAMTLFFAAYFAEIVRAGLQGVPHSQTEAALSLGFGPVETLRHVILPQALKAVVPVLVTLAIGILQSTTLVAAIGIFDLLNASRAAANDPAWLGFYDEAYVFAGLIYFAACFGASRYSLWLEKRL